LAAASAWGSKKGGWRIPDLVFQETVVRVHRRRAHRPLLPIDRLAELAGGHLYSRFQWSYTGNILNGVDRPRIVQPAYQISDFKVGFSKNRGGS